MHMDGKGGGMEIRRKVRGNCGRKIDGWIDRWKEGRQGERKTVYIKTRIVSASVGSGEYKLTEIVSGRRSYLCFSGSFTS